MFLNHFIEYDDKEIWEKIDTSIISKIIDGWTNSKSIHNRVLEKIVLLGDRDAILYFAPHWMGLELNILDAVVRRFSHLHERYQSKLIHEYLEEVTEPPLRIFFELWKSAKDTNRNNLLDMVTRIVRRGVIDGMDNVLLSKLARDGSSPYWQLVKELIEVLPKNYPNLDFLLRVLRDSANQ